MKKQITEIDYKNRINEVIDYIQKNIHKNFTLEELSEIANFSKFHFHRIFKSFVGNTLNEYILKIKIQKSCTILKNHPNYPLIELAYKMGFSSQSSFTKTFKKYMKITPKKYLKNSNIEQEIISKKDYNLNDASKYIEKIELVNYEKMDYIYFRTYEGYGKHISKLWSELYKYAYKNNINIKGQKMLGISYDDPNVVEKNKCRYDACITIPDKNQAKDISTSSIEAGKYYSFNVVIKTKDYPLIYDYIYCVFLPNKNLMPSNHPSFEIYLSNKNNKFKTIINIPIEMRSDYYEN